MFRRYLLVLLSAALCAAPGCTKSGSAPAAEEAAEIAIEGSELSKFRASRTKKRKRKKTKASVPPTRDEGATAMIEARLLLEEADFRAAESELRIAAAAGVAGADDLLARVRSEIVAENLIIAAQKKEAAGDWQGARADLSRVLPGLILSTIAERQLARLDEREAATRKQMLDKATERLSGEGAESSAR